MMPQETETERDRRIAWWREARLGLFIHWGPSSVVGKEISWARAGHPFDSQGGSREVPDAEYDALFKRFNPVKFDADAWMSLAKDAGMKYVVFTTKHHDGFSMWLTRLSDYSIAKTPFKRDICAELAAAAHRHGLKLGWYYSTRDWFHPDYLKDGNGKYNDFYHGQLRELLTQYGKVDLLWFDHVAGNWRDYRFPELFSMIRELQPGILINNRAAAFVTKTGDQPSPEIRELVRGDFDTPEQTVGEFQNHRPWESCVTMTECEDGGGWSYRPDGRDRGFAECLGLLRACATGDGNFLLNVGPMPNGEIAANQQAVLRRLGAWLRDNGGSVRGTRGGPFRNGAWGGSTHCGDTVYLHPAPGIGDKLRLPPLRAKIVRASAHMEQTANGVEVTLPPERLGDAGLVVELKLDAPAAAEFRDGAPLDVGDLACVKPPARVWCFADATDAQPIHCSLVAGDAKTPSGQACLEVAIPAGTPSSRLRLLDCGGLKAGRHYEASFLCMASDFAQLRLGDAGRPLVVGPFWQALTLNFAVLEGTGDFLEFLLPCFPSPLRLNFGPVSLRELPPPPPFPGLWNVSFGEETIPVALVDGEVDLASIRGVFRERDRATLRCQFTLSAPRRARFGMGADFWLKLRLNDAVILDVLGRRHGRDTHVLELDLPAGLNRFEAEVLAGSRGWSFCCGVPSPNMVHGRWAGLDLHG